MFSLLKPFNGCWKALTIFLGLNITKSDFFNQKKINFNKFWKIVHTISLIRILLVIKLLNNFFFLIKVLHNFITVQQMFQVMLCNLFTWLCGKHVAVTLHYLYPTLTFSWVVLNAATNMYLCIHILFLLRYIIIV